MYDKNTTYYQKETYNTIIYKKKQRHSLSDLDRCKADKNGILFVTCTIIDQTFKAKVININSVNYHENIIKIKYISIYKKTGSSPINSF